MSDILKLLEASWAKVTQKINGPSEVRPYWSEADLVCSLATEYQSSLQTTIDKDLVVHVSSSLTPNPDLFGEDLVGRSEQFMHKYRLATRRKRVKVIPDLIVHNANDEDVNHLHLCAEVKLILGTNYWASKLDGLGNDLERMILFRDVKVCDEVAILVGFSPGDELLKEQGELHTMLDKWQKKELSLTSEI